MELTANQSRIHTTLILIKNKVQHECRMSVEKRPKAAIFFGIFRVANFLSHCFYKKALIKTG